MRLYFGCRTKGNTMKAKRKPTKRKSKKKPQPKQYSTWLIVKSTGGVVKDVLHITARTLEITFSILGVGVKVLHEISVMIRKEHSKKAVR